ncbi:MAG: ATP-binding cassette domain-containing protein [Eubacterium sp.]
MIKLEDVKKYYGEKLVLDINSLSISNGERVALVGANGSGKSTLLKLISRVIAPSEGDITTDGEIIYMPQSNYAFNKSVIKNVLLGTKAPKEQAEQLLRQMEISEFANKNAKNLSGGELQKVALCRTIIRNSNVLLLDEPTSEMDLHSTNIAENAILDYIKKENATLIISTHSPSQAKKLADRIIILNNGVIVEDGSIDETINAPKTSWGEEFLSQWIIKR